RLPRRADWLPVDDNLVIDAVEGRRSPSARPSRRPSPVPCFVGIPDLLAVVAAVSVPRSRVSPVRDLPRQRAPSVSVGSIALLGARARSAGASPALAAV